MSHYSSYIFIITYGRSGSTLLQNILNSINGYFISGENENALFGMYTSYDAALSAKTKYGLKETGSENPWYGADGIEPERYGRALTRLFIDEIIHPPSNARVVGFKEIRFFLYPWHFEPYLQFIEKFFNPAKLIFNVRDPNEVAKSAWWNNQDTATVIKKVENYHTLIDQYMARFPENCCKVNYNDYQDNPGNLKDLFDFLSEPFDEELISRIMAVKLTH